MEETINHVLFECPPVLQTWAISQIPSAPGIFPLTSIFANIDYLFWRLQRDSSELSWIISYIWKANNEKKIKNLDRDPNGILRVAETETTL